MITDLHLPYPQSNNNKSRLETRLQELKHDQETLQSIKHLQDSVRCETKRNPWIMDQVEEPMTRYDLLYVLSVSERLQQLVRYYRHQFRNTHSSDGY